MGTTPHDRPPGHVLLPAAAIGLLSTLLAAGLGLLGILDRVDLTIGRIVMQGKATGFPKSLPPWSVWLAAVVFAFGLSFAILNVPGTWRRFMIWITALVLTAGWAPTLALAAHSPDIGAPLIAAVWSGVCALVYAGNHRMACDGSAEKLHSNKIHEAR